MSVAAARSSGNAAPPPPDAAVYAAVRSAFAYFDPDLDNPVFMENAGGSQVRQRRLAATR